jgi:major capsid protein
MTITQAPLYQYWEALQWYHNAFEDRFGQNSITASMLDQSQNYLDNAGSVRNPLAPYNDNSFEQTRGGYFGMVVTSNTPTAATILLTITEPIYISPFVTGKCSDFTSAFIGVQNMNYNCTFGDLTRIMSLEQNQGTLGSPTGTITITGVTTTLNSASLLYEYITPDPLVPIPKSLESSYFSIVSYPTRSSVPMVPYNPLLPNGNLQSFTMQSVQLTSIPRRIYIACRRDDSTQTAFTTDTYLALPQLSNPLTVTWNNNQFFSQATTQDLYNMSVKNGLQMSYSQFVNFTGSVICIDLSTDLGLMPDEAPGLIGNYQLGLTCQFVNTNLTQTIVSPTLYVVVVYEGVFNVMDGNCSHMIGVLSRSDILNAQKNPFITYKRSQDVWGGRMFDKIRHLASKAHDIVKKGKVLSNVTSLIPHPAAQVGSKILSNLGYGKSGGRMRKYRGCGLSEIKEDSFLNNKDIANRLKASDLFEDEFGDECEDNYDSE